MRRYLATGGDERLDRAIAAVAGLSRRAARSAIEEGSVWLNAKPCRVASRTVRLGDVIDLLVSAEVETSPPSRLPDLPFLLDDGWLVAIDKPRGMHTQPPRDRHPGQLSAHEVAALHSSLRAGHRIELKLFHRLDRMTSGVLVFACNHEAARGLARIWGSGRAVKRYLAIVHGTPAASFEIDEPILADRASPGRFRTGRSGRPARTLVRTLTTADDFSLVEVRPLTGRTHQVRVHLASRGFSVVGDSLYGGGISPPGPFLHAWRLELPHPRDQRPLRLEAPPPSDFAVFLAARGVEMAAALK